MYDFTIKSQIKGPFVVFILIEFKILNKIHFQHEIVYKNHFRLL